MNTPVAILFGFFITLLLMILGLLLEGITKDLQKLTRKQILVAVAFLVTWAGITMVLRWWM